MLFITQSFYAFLKKYKRKFIKIAYLWTSFSSSRFGILISKQTSLTSPSGPMPVSPCSLSALADTRRIHDHARVGVRHRSASGRRAESRRGVEEVDDMSDEERRRDRTTQRKWAVREMAPNRLVCRWTHYLSHADTTDIVDARLIALMASLRVRVSRAIRAAEAEGGN